MSCLSLEYFPSRVLRKISEPISQDSALMQALFDDLFDTMHAAPGVGLSAIQVGSAKRVFVVDVPAEEGGYGMETYINPEIVEYSPTTFVNQEGCLSFPGQFAPVERSTNCTVRYWDRNFDEKTQECSKLLSIAVQHEVDHLNGILFIDHISRLRRAPIEKKMRKAHKQGTLASFDQRLRSRSSGYK